MMKTLILLCMICVTGSFAQFTPTVTMTCTATAYTITITGATSTGQVYVDGQCAAQSTTTGTSTHTFDAAACTVGSLPAIGTSFTVVVQENAALELSTDYVVSCTCNKDLSPKTETIVGATVSNEASEGSATSSLAPTFTLSLEDGSGGALTSGAVGTSAVLKVTMDAAYQSDFDHQITTIAANSLTVVTSGCSSYTAIAHANAASASGVVSWSFNLFIPYTTATRAATLVGLSVTIGVCDGTCTPLTCGTRKRRNVEEMSNSTTLSTSVVVYPEEYFSNLENKGDRQEEENVCVSRTPMVAALAGLALSMAVCLILTIFMFFRMRKSNRKNKADDMYAHHNVGYKH